MHQSSERIGAIAGALAAAQAELTNPEKTLSATICSPFHARRVGLSATLHLLAVSTSCAKH